MESKEETLNLCTPLKLESVGTSTGVQSVFASKDGK